MIDVNALINNVYHKLNIVGESQNVNGTKARNAEDDLNGIIADLNHEEYIADNIRINILRKSKVITIGNNPSCDIVSNPPPAVKHVGRKSGQKFIRIYKSNLEGIFGTMSSSMPSLYNYRVDYDDELGIMVGKLIFNGSASCEFLVTFIDEIPQVSINDTLNLQDIYKNLLEAGLAEESCKRYKIRDWLDVYADDFIDAKNDIKTINTNNRPIVWDDGQGSYMDSYYAGLNGEGL